MTGDLSIAWLQNNGGELDHESPRNASFSSSWYLSSPLHVRLVSDTWYSEAPIDLTASGTVEATDARPWISNTRQNRSCALFASVIELHSGDTLAMLDDAELTAREDAARAQVAACTGTSSPNCRVVFVRRRDRTSSGRRTRNRTTSRGCPRRRPTLHSIVRRWRHQSRGIGQTRNRSGRSRRLSTNEPPNNCDCVETGARSEQVAAARSSRSPGRSKCGTVVEANLRPVKNPGAIRRSRDTSSQGTRRNRWTRRPRRFRYQFGRPLGTCLRSRGCDWTTGVGPRRTT